jgi:hypothetical protein
LALIALVAWAPAAGAIDCSGWDRLTEDQKIGKIGSMIESHMNSNVGKRYTSENRPAMRRCLYDFAEEIRDQFDGACAEGSSAALDAFDQIFDRYFLSCVQ